MPTTQELPHPPLEGSGFFQREPSGVDTTVEPPEGAANAALALEGREAERERGKGRAERKSRPNTEPGEAALDSKVKESLPEGKRVKFNIEETRVAYDTPPLDEDLGNTGRDTITTPHCDTGEQSGEVESELAPPPGEDVETCFKRITSESQMLFSKWKEALQESEAFESFFPSRVDELIKEAYALEESLKERKEVMRKRVNAIASTLQSFGNS